MPDFDMFEKRLTLVEKQTEAARQSIKTTKLLGDADIKELAKHVNQMLKDFKKLEDRVKKLEKGSKK